MNLKDIYLEILIGQVEMINSVFIGFKSLEFIIIKLYSFGVLPAIILS